MRLSEEQKATMQQLFAKHGLDYGKARDGFRKQYPLVPETESARYWRLCRYRSNDDANSLAAKTSARRTRTPTTPLNYRLSVDPDIIR